MKGTGPRRHEDDLGVQSVRSRRREPERDRPRGNAEQVRRIESGRVAGVRRDRARRAEVEAGGRSPPELDLVEQRLILHRRYDQPDLVGNHHAAGLQEAHPSVCEVLEDPRLQPEAPYLVCEDDVDCLRQGHTRRQPLDVSDPVLEPVGLGDLSGQPYDRPLVDRIDALGPGAAGHEPENPGAGTKVEHDVARRDDLLDRVAEGAHAVAVGEILPMLVQDERHQTVRARRRRLVTGTPSSWDPRRRGSACPCASAFRRVRTR